MSAGVVVEFGPWGSGLYSGFSVVESDIYCRIWCHMFVKTVRTVRLRYAFTQIVMIRSHFHCRNTVSKYWYFSETTQSFQLTSHPTQAAYGGWLETGDLTQVYTTKTTQITFFSDWYKIGFEIKNEIEGQGQSSPKFSGILRVLRCIIGPNLGILSWIGGEWWHGQGQNMAIFYFEVKFDLEGQGQSPPKTIGILTKVFYTYGANLVILAWTGVELSRGQASDYRTHGRTDTQTDAGNDNTRRPKLASGKNYTRFSVYFWSKSVLYSQWLCNYGDVPKCLKYLKSCVIKEYTKVVIWEVCILSTSQGWCMWFMFCCLGLVMVSFPLMA